MNRIGSGTGRHVLCHRIARWYAAGLFSLYALLLLVHRAAPALTDYSDWTYEGVLLRNHLLGMSDPYHVLKHYPVPNSLTTVGIGLLALVFSWQLAAKLWLCVLLLVALLSAKHMMRSCSADVAMWLIAPAAIFLNVNLWYGFINFQWGLCWSVLIASLLLRGERRDWIFGVLLTLAFFSHMIPFTFSALLLILFALQTRRLRLLWQLVPGILLSLWYLFGRFIMEGNADGHAGMVNPVRTYSAAFWAYKVNSYLKSFGFVNAGTPHGSVSVRVLGVPVFLFLFLLNIILCGTIAWCVITAALSAFREQKKERFIWVAASIFFVLFLLAPGTMLGISDPGSRLLQTVIAIVVFQCFAVAGRYARARRVAVVCAMALQIAAVFQFNRVVFSPEMRAETVRQLPIRVTIFSHVPNHVEDFFYEALERGDMARQIFPTAMFLDTPEAEVFSPNSPRSLPP